MARSRTLKVGFFTNEVLGALPPLARLLFAGLWCLADRDGRLEDRPERIRREVLGYDDEADADELLTMLDRTFFIHRYVVNGIGFIQICAWSKHQKPHPREVKSYIPPCEDGCVCHDSRGSARFSGAQRAERHNQGSPKANQGNAKAMPSREKDMTSPAGSSGSSGPSGPSGPSDFSLTSYVSGTDTLKAAQENSRGSRLPDDWQLPKPWGEWAMTEGGMSRAEVVKTAAVFADYWHSKAGKDATKVNWLATWRNWVRRAQGEFGTGPKANGNGSKSYAQQRDEARKRLVKGLTGYDPDAVQNGGDVIDVDAEIVNHEHDR